MSSLVSTDDINGPVEIAITQYILDPSKIMKENVHPFEKFDFRPCLTEEIKIQIKISDPKGISLLQHNNSCKGASSSFMVKKAETPTK